jgi:serine/threonine-protein kinase
MQVCSVCSRCYSDAETACVDPVHSELIEVPQRSIDMVPGYRIVRSLRSSPRVEKFLAKQNDTDAKCIVNVVALNGGDPQSFLNNAKAAEAMVHPNIVDVYGSGLLENGDAFYVSETTRSRSLREILKDGIPPLLTAIEIARETAEAVHAMHTSSLVHGAIRPENIIVSEDDAVDHRVKIYNPDFGGAVQNSIISNKLTMDAAMGVIRYFAPEQFSAGVPTHQTDVYALGVLLYEMLSGQPPFGGENASELIERIRNEHPADLQINNFDLRMLLTHTLMQALQKQPAFRQPTALAFARQLRHMEQLATHSATPPVPFPGAIPQKQAAVAAAAGLSSSPSTANVANRQKRLEITNVKKLDLQTAVKPKGTPPVPAQKKAVEMPATTADVRPQPDSTGDLNKSRLRNWKEKYQAASSAFRSESKSGLQQLSLATPPVRKEANDAIPNVELHAPGVVEAPKPTRIKIEWDESSDDLPTLDAVKKAKAEELVNESSEMTSETAEAKEPTARATPPFKTKNAVRPEMFADYAKSPRVRKRVSNVPRAGLLAALGPFSGIAKNRRFLAGGLAVALILGLFIGSSLLQSKDAKPSAAETQETKIVTPGTIEPEKVVPTEIAVETKETIAEIPAPVVNDSSEVSRLALPKPPKPTAKDPARDQVSDPQRKNASTAVATQVSNKPTPAKTAPKPALTPSTLVISPGNGKVQSKVEPGNGSAFTRPRIVANPKP